MLDTVMPASLDKRQDTIGCDFLTFYFAYRTRGISNTVTNMMSGIFAGVSNRAVLQIGWCFK